MQKIPRSITTAPRSIQSLSNQCVAIIAKPFCRLKAPGDLRMEICGALGLIANSKDDAAIKALGMIAGEKKGKNKALKSAANDALKKVKNRN